MLNNLFEPSFYDYDDGAYYYMSPPTQYESLRRQEAATRRRRLEELEYLRQLEEEQAYRRKLAKIRAAQQDQFRRQRDVPASYQIVRGRDGRYYRVPLPVDDIQVREKPSISGRVPHNGKKQKKKNELSYFLGPDGYLYRVATPSGETDLASDSEDEPLVNTNVPRTSGRNPRHIQRARTADSSGPWNATNHPDLLIVENSKASNHESDEQPVSVDKKSSNKSARAKKKVTVIVEDASDSENDDDYKSIWRNRRPSPGEWMEPVVYEI